MFAIFLEKNLESFETAFFDSRHLGYIAATQMHLLRFSNLVTSFACLSIYRCEDVRLHPFNSMLYVLAVFIQGNTTASLTVCKMGFCRSSFQTYLIHI